MITRFERISALVTGPLAVGLWIAALILALLALAALGLVFDAGRRLRPTTS